MKARLLTFGGAYAVIPFQPKTGGESQDWLTADQFAADDARFWTFVGYLAGPGHADEGATGSDEGGATKRPAPKQATAG